MNAAIMNEEAIRMGRDGQLVGILTSGSESADAPVAILFNAGFLHRVGPYRLWVDLARELAGRDIPSLRFDLQGLGDSVSLAQGEDPSDHAMASLSEALDYVESRLGKRDFVLIGLCSGADYAHPAAKSDSRIRGIVFIDGYGYRTKAYRVNHQLRRIISGRRWKNLMLRTLGFGPELCAQELATSDVREFPDVDQVQDDILRFLEEGRRLHYVYTDGVPEYYNYESQFWEMFPRLKPHPGLSTSYFAETDHTFALVSDRARLMRQLVDFVSARKGSTA